MLVITPTLYRPETLCMEVLEIVQSEMLTHDIICRFKVDDGYHKLNIDWAELDPSRVKQVVSDTPAEMR
jgi:hypothetical protein